MGPIVWPYLTSSKKMMVRMGDVLASEGSVIASSGVETEEWEVDAWLNYPSEDVSMPLDQGDNYMAIVKSHTMTAEGNEENLERKPLLNLEAQSSETSRKNEEMQVSATESAPNAITGEQLGETIWKTTLTYLQEATGLLSSPCNTSPTPAPESLISASPNIELPPASPESLISLISTLKTYLSSPVVKKTQPHQRHVRVKAKIASQSRHIGESNSSFLYSFLAKKGKKGRKPHPLKCFMCAAVLPYKRDFIYHLRDVHGIERSQSLMYKRINQGAEEIKKRYCAPKQVFKITVSR